MRISLIVVLMIAAALMLTGVTISDAARTGKAVYESKCKMCHGTGAMGAPKLGSDTFKALLKKEGIDKLTEDAMKGKGKMPARGMCKDCSKDEIKAAIEYMTK